MARLLFLTSSFPASPEDGVCGYVFDLARRLVEDHGYDARVLAPGGSNAGGDSRFAPVRVERFAHPWAGSRRLRADRDLGATIGSSLSARIESAPFIASFAHAAARAARTADVICSHWLVPAGVIGAALRRARRPHIAIAHGGDVHLLGRLPGGAALARRIAARTDRLFCVSGDLRDRLARLVPEASGKTDVLPMGAEIGPPANPDDVARTRARLNAADRPVVLFLGRLLPIKGVDVLVDAAASAPEAAIWIAGDGPEFERLRERAQAARLHVSFLGTVGRAERRVLLDACDAVVVPSRIEERTRRMEGTPVVCAESFTAGKPVIGTYTGGIVEIVEHERTGLLVPPGDVQALASAISRFATDRDLRTRLTANARQRSSGFSAAATARRFAQAIERLKP